MDIYFAISFLIRLPSVTGLKQIRSSYTYAVFLGSIGDREQNALALVALTGPDMEISLNPA